MDAPPAQRAPTGSTQRVEAIARFSGVAMQQAVGVAELLQAACRAACDGSGVSRSKVLVYHVESDDFTVDAGIGWAPGVIGMRVPAHLRTVPGHTFKTDRPCVVEHLPDNPSFDYHEPLRSHAIRSAANVPIRTGQEAVGVLEIDSDVLPALDGADLAFLESLAGLLATAVVRTNVEEAARRTAAKVAMLAAEREFLAAELEHRVANQLQQAQLALRLEQRRAVDEDAKDAIRRAADRLGAMLSVQDRLKPASPDDERMVAIAPLLEALARDLAQPGISIEVRCDSSSVSTDQAVTIGQLMHEIVMNAVKHAFVDRPAGRIAITFVAASDTDPHCTLVLADDGHGMGAQRAGGLGLGLIGQLASRLQASLQIDETPGTGGTRYQLRFAPAPGVSSPDADVTSSTQPPIDPA